MPQKPQHRRRYRLIPGMLRQLREEAGLTQRELAAHLGEPQPWIHYCETGSRRVDVAEFVDWARACGVAPTTALQRFLRAKS